MSTVWEFKILTYIRITCPRFPVINRFCFCITRRLFILFTLQKFHFLPVLTIKTVSLQRIGGVSANRSIPPYFRLIILKQDRNHGKR